MRLGHSHCEQPYTFRGEADPNEASEENAEGNDLLQENKQREDNDPKQVHHPRKQTLIGIGDVRDGPAA
jgi:hypothetical protein